jgi:hypothetical protein
MVTLSEDKSADPAAFRVKTKLDRATPNFLYLRFEGECQELH